MTRLAFLLASLSLTSCLAFDESFLSVSLLRTWDGLLDSETFLLERAVSTCIRTFITHC